MKVKHITVLGAALIWCLTGIAPNLTHAFQIPNSYQWTVRVPGNIPFESCNITMHAGGYEKIVVLQRGQSYTWTAPYNIQLTTIGAWRIDTYGNRVHLVSRTCAGTDYENGYADIQCAHNVNVKVCAKPAFSPDPFSGPKFGFCPD